MAVNLMGGTHRLIAATGLVFLLVECAPPQALLPGPTLP